MKKSIIIILVLIAAGAGYYFWKKKQHHKKIRFQSKPPVTKKGQSIRPKKLVYKVKKGDTLSKIAKEFKTTVTKILQVNARVKNKNLIYPGQILNIPA